MSKNDWQQQEIGKLKAEHGTVPPPYVLVHAHPYSMAWRMGYGESLMMLWYDWVEEKGWGKKEKIVHFLKFPPPDAWLEWVLCNLNPELGETMIEDGIETEEEIYEFIKPYFAEMETLGFGSFDDWVADFESEDWLDNDPLR